MELSTRARYTVEAMIDLALHNDSNENISLNSISNRISISMSYLEQLFAKLRRANIVSSIKGPKGGYKLNKSLSEITILEIILAVDEPLETRSCKGKMHNSLGCTPHNKKCKSHDLWEGLLKEIKNYLGNVTLEDIIKNLNTIDYSSKTPEASSEVIQR